MATAYTPGLVVTERTVVRKTRRLPLKGDVLVALGDCVEPDSVVARTELPGPLTTVRVAEKLGLEPPELGPAMLKREGDSVEAGELLGQTKSFFGLFTSACQSPVSGVIEYVSQVTGNVGVRHPARPVEVLAYLRGQVEEVLEGDGAVIRTEAAYVQGIFGVGGERQGSLACVATSAEETVSSEALSAAHAGKIVVCGGLVTADVLEAAARVGAAGVVGGGILDADLTQLLGYEIGVAITGNENLPFTLIVTEGFGAIPMAKRTFDLLRSLDGQRASISGATQIRAGVLRPEVIVPRSAATADGGTAPAQQSTQLVEGAPLRLIREPYFGRLATVTGLPSELQEVESGARVRVLRARLASGEEVTVPRANVELIEG
jgi:hypothetical protein